MGYPEYQCVGCKQEHGAAFWYYREDKGRKEYLCGAKYNELPEKNGWIALEST